MLKLLWQKWKIIAHKIADVQARGILFLFYYVVLPPFALGMKIFSDPLQLRTDKGWLERAELEGDARAQAGRQF
jgi:hypothetical protein